MDLLLKIALVAAGSVVGGLARWGVSELFARRLGVAFPWGTLFINLTGSMFLGWFMTVFEERLAADGLGWFSPGNLRLLVALGFTGSYTTFSTYEYETHRLLGDGLGLAGITYLCGSMFLGLLAVRGGVLLARWQ